MAEFIADVSKVCTSCQENKPNSEFYRHYASKFGTRAMCMACSRDKDKERMSTSSAKRLQNNRNEARKRRRSTSIVAKIDALCWWSKSRAKRSGIGHTITKEYLREIYEKQLKVCALTGREFNLLPYHSNGVSLDRINNQEGYHIGNVQLVTSAANMAKSSLTEEELVMLCNDIVQTKGDRHS